MLNLAVFASGFGSNLQAVMNAIDAKEIDADIKIVFSDNKNAKALDRARAFGAKAKAVDPKNYELILNHLRENNVDLVVLAGYLKLMPKEVIRAYENKIINVHPSLIPAFSGKGFYGLAVHNAVLKRGVKVSGATVHIVNERFDEGKILIQEAIAVLPNDTAETLQKRILENVEWKILVNAIKLFIT
jgi:phosphoribosylglycinamide formyltransferase-1